MQWKRAVPSPCHFKAFQNGRAVQAVRLADGGTLVGRHDGVWLLGGPSHSSRSSPPTRLLPGRFGAPPNPPGINNSNNSNNKDKTTTHTHKGLDVLHELV